MTTTIEAWFAAKGWQPFDYQRQAWAAYRDGRSGLVHAPTGMGKSYAVWLGIVQEWLAENPDPAAWPRTPEPLRALWITPMRALAGDTLVSLQAPIIELDIPWTIDRRTGDTTGAVRRQQKKRLPTALVTTPESLSLLLSYPDARERLGTVRAVIVDEWHELLSTKRGVQTELALARLRSWNPALRTWGLSATLGNLDQALEVLLGRPPRRPRPRLGRPLKNGTGSEQHGQSAEENRREVPVPIFQHATSTGAAAHATPNGTADATTAAIASHPTPPRERGLIISGQSTKPLSIETIVPADIDRFPWSGHLGTRLLSDVIGRIERARTTLIFTNTRSQAEIWFRSLLRARPDWAAELALHHGSLDRDLRAYVEDRLRAGTIRAVVCTSSLDLGVDFSPVDQVLQVGSPKGIARLLQRAGRSGHQPGALSRVVCVPTHSFELIEFAAARQAALAGLIEGRDPIERPLDVLAQHLVTVALGGGFTTRQLFDEVRTTHAFRRLSRVEWQWVLDFVTRGGPALRAYPQYARIRKKRGRYAATDALVTRMHRMSIGTITSESSILVRYMAGGTLGTIEESFIARIKPGDRFVFAGQTLELVRYRDMTAYVRKSSRTSGIVPRWDGGRFPLSSQLAAAVRRQFSLARRGIYRTVEMEAVRPLMELQARWSDLPGPKELLIEHSRVREGYQWFVFPFEGRSVNEGLASLLAYRLSRRAPASITITPNDYGFELLSSVPFELGEAEWRALLSTDRLREDLLDCLNTGELARRQFRDIARVAGLVFQGYPGAPRSARQLQASSGLLYDVFLEYDAQNMLLDQARREVLDRQLETSRLGRVLARLAGKRLLINDTPRLTPLAFPLWAARIQTSHLTSERWTNRIHRMIAQLEKAADPPPREPKKKLVPR
jgi:ATP-dependent Lhr-like helicase